MEQLLAQLEAKSVALVPYGYWNQPQAQARKLNTWLLSTVLGCVWLSTFVLAIVNFSYKRSSQVAEDGVGATPLVIHSPSDPQNQKPSESLDHLAEALISSSERLNTIEVALEKSNQDLQQLKTKLNTEGARTVLPQPEAIPTEIKKNADTAVPRALATLAANAAVAQVANVGLAPISKPTLEVPFPKTSPKSPYRILSIKPTDDATPHKADDGTIDYWLVARGAFKELAKVQPIAITAGGVVIHNLEDGKNYALTRQGEWRDPEW